LDGTYQTEQEWCIDRLREKRDFMMLKGINFFLIVVLVILIGLKVSGKEKYKSPDYTQYVAEVICQFTKEMYKEYGFECGASGGEMPYDVETILVQLVAYQSATIEQARELEVKATERFKQIINAHEKIRPFLREYPFPANRAHVTLSFREKGKRFSTHSEVEFICHARNKLHYLGHDPEHPHVGKLIKEEPYEGALKIVQSNAVKNEKQQPKFL
jgi:cytochrome c556